MTPRKNITLQLSNNVAKTHLLFALIALLGVPKYMFS